MPKIRIEGEGKNAKFKRIASARTNVILKRIRILGNCSNKSVYEYTDDEIKTIFDAIEKELHQTRSRFEKQKKTEIEFKLL